MQYATAQHVSQPELCKHFNHLTNVVRIYSLVDILGTGIPRACLWTGAMEICLKTQDFYSIYLVQYVQTDGSKDQKLIPAFLPLSIFLLITGCPSQSKPMDTGLQLVMTCCQMVAKSDHSYAPLGCQNRKGEDAT